MEMDITLTDLFWCPSCGFRGLFKAEPTALCEVYMWKVVGDRRLQTLYVLDPRRKGANQNMGCKFLQGPQRIES